MHCAVKVTYAGGAPKPPVPSLLWPLVLLTARNIVLPSTNPVPVVLGVGVGMVIVLSVHPNHFIILGGAVASVLVGAPVSRCKSTKS